MSENFKKEFFRRARAQFEIIPATKDKISPPRPGAKKQRPSAEKLGDEVEKRVFPPAPMRKAEKCIAGCVASRIRVCVCV